MSVNLSAFKDKEAYVSRNVQLKEDLGVFVDTKMNHILNHRGLEHPFLNHYAKQGLSAGASKLLYLETLHYFKNLPFYVCGISTITLDEGILRSITFNARDELGRTKSHSDLYRGFLRKKGISEEQIDNYECLPSTTALNDGIRFLYSHLPLQKALGALFADETMSAAMVSKYNDGLIKEGLSENDRRFWTLHMEVEVGHSNAVFNIMEKYLQTTMDRKLFTEGINQYMHLMEMYWNGIEQLIGEKNEYIIQ